MTPPVFWSVATRFCVDASPEFESVRLKLTVSPGSGEPLVPQLSDEIASTGDVNSGIGWSEKLSVRFSPLTTVTETVSERNPGLEAVTVYVPGTTDIGPYVPDKTDRRE